MGPFIHVTGQPAFGSFWYTREVYRCNGCEYEIKANLPTGVKPEVRYGPSAMAACAISRYVKGCPNYRFDKNQGLQDWQIPASTMFYLCEKLQIIMSAVFHLLQKLVASTSLAMIDDSFITILKPRGYQEARKGWITGVVGWSGENRIMIFNTSLEVAGKFLGELLARRTNSPPMIVMSDAANMNNPPKEYNHMVSQVYCLVHARRNFFELRRRFPDDCEPVLELMAKIWKVEGECAKEKLCDEDRLIRHKEKSGPIMKKLKKMGTRLLANHEVEPNSDLGRAWNYFLNHYEKLTGFLRIPGCPVDNNETERLLKKAITHRKNSLFYRNEIGAGVGDVIMTLAFTGLAAGVDLHAWFSDMGENPDAVKDNPEAWLPWNWKRNRTWKPWQEREIPNIHYSTCRWEDIKDNYSHQRDKSDKVQSMQPDPGTLAA